MSYKICMLSQDFPPQSGGISAHVFELSKKLAELGNEVHVITPRFSFDEAIYELINGVHVHRIYQIRKKDASGMLYIPILSWLQYMPSAIVKMKSLIEKEAIEIIHYHSLFPESIITKFFKNKTLVFTNHESGFLRLAEKNHYIRLKFLLSHPDMIIGPSIELSTVVQKFGVLAENTIYIPNGVDAQKFNPNISNNLIRSKYNLQQSCSVVLCPRRLEPKNGVVYLIDAIPKVLKECEAIRFLIVGEGSERAKIEKLIEKYNINDYVILTGNTSYTDMPYYYSASDIVVLPSLMEATSIAGLEAMASGKPLVGTKVGGLPLIIEHNKTGLIVPPKNSDAIADAIVLLLDEHKRSMFGKNARDKVTREFSWDVIAKKTLNVYKNLIIK